MAGTARLRRLLALLPSSRMGGAEAHTLRVLEAAAAQGVTVTVAAEPVLGDRLAGPGRRVLPAGLVGQEGAAETARSRQAEAAAAALDAATPDAVLLPLPWPDHAAGIMRALAERGVPTLVVAHLVPHTPPPGVDDALRADAARMRASWTAVSGPSGARLADQLGLPPGVVATVPNGVDQPAEADPGALRARLGALAGAPVALFLGRLDRAKGADLLPAIAEALARRRPGALLACAGDGSLRALLGEKAPPGHPLRLLGQEPRPEMLLRGADLLVMPSRLEGAPLTFLEAAHCGLPVAATAEALEAEPHPTRLARIGPAGDAGSFAAVVEALLADPVETARRAAAARRLAVAWDGAAMAARYLAILRALVAASPWRTPGGVG